MLYSQISYVSGAGITMDIWEMPLSAVEEELPHFRKSNSIRERFCYKLMATNTDVNCPKRVLDRVRCWAGVHNWNGENPELMYDVQVIRNQFMVLFQIIQCIRRQEEFWYGEVRLRNRTVWLSRVRPAEGELNLESAIRMVLTNYGSYWEKMLSAVTSSAISEKGVIPTDDWDYRYLMDYDKEETTQCTNS